MRTLQGQTVRSLPSATCHVYRQGHLERSCCSVGRWPASQHTGCRKSQNPSIRPGTAIAVFGQGLPGLGGGEVFIAGGSSPVAVRLIQQLLQSGSKVAAGVADVAGAERLLDFAKKFELVDGKSAQNLRLVELDTSNDQAVADALPGGATVVLIPGDSPYGLDARAGIRILSIAQEAGAGKIVLVQPKGGGGGGGFLGLFGGGGQKLEQAIADSGVRFAIVRTGKQAADVGTEQLGNISLGKQSSLPSGASISKGQVAQVVAEVLRQASEDVLVETWASPSAPEVSLSSLLLEVLPTAVVAEEESDKPEAEQESESEPEPVKELFRGPRRGGGEQEEEEAAAKPAGLFALGKKKAAAAQSDAPEQAKKASRGLFASGKSQAQQVQQETAEPAKKAGRLFTFGKSQAQEAALEQAEKASTGLFGLGGGKQRQPAAGAPSAPSSNGKPFGGLFGGGRKGQEETSSKPESGIGRARKSANKKATRKIPGLGGRQAGREEAEAGPETNTGGFFKALGFGAASQFDDED